MNQLDSLPLFSGNTDLTDIARVHVHVKPHSYEILVAAGILSKVDQVWQSLKLSGQVLIVSDQVVFDLYGNILLANFNYLGINPVVHLVPQGETTKCNDQLNLIYDVLAEHRFSRDSNIIALGGGVVGDLAGYAAATYMRGINLIQIPTTLLAQVDSSIGGKTGINHRLGKNLIGAFYQPRVVLIDVDVLGSLPSRELKTGMAEVIKYGIIDDFKFFMFLESHRDKLGTFSHEDTALWRDIILNSCRVKAKVVSLDEREQGLRAILNFGHTLAHGIETMTNYITFNHGEAVSVGMVGAALLSLNRGLIDHQYASRIIELLKHIGLPIGFETPDISEMLDLLLLDKKAKSGRLRFVLPTKVGLVEIFSDISDNEIKHVLEELKKL